MQVVEVDIVDSQKLQTFLTGGDGVGGRAVQQRKLVLDKAELCSEKNVGAFAGALEPFP